MAERKRCGYCCRIIKKIAPVFTIALIVTVIVIRIKLILAILSGIIAAFVRAGGI